MKTEDIHRSQKDLKRPAYKKIRAGIKKINDGSENINAESEIINPGGINKTNKQITAIMEEAVLSGLFPRRCPVCNDITVSGYICRECAERLRLIKNPVCLKCGREILEGDTCRNCERHNFSFDLHRALFNYNEDIAESLGRIKYSSKREYLDYYALESARHFYAEFRKYGIQAILPVPVHKTRYLERGFNQAEVYADRLSDLTGIPMLSEIIKRDRKTRALKNLNPEERFTDLFNAFHAENVPKGLKRVLLVDDIFTTGATMEAVSRALKSKGIEEVYGFSIAIRSER